MNPSIARSSALLWRLLCFLLMVTLPGCQACENGDLPADAAPLPKKSERVVEQGVCSSDACVVGARGCDDQGDIIECVLDEAGCGVWGENPITECPAEHWCYQGTCTWVDSEPVPEPASAEVPSLFSLPGPHEPIPDHVTVIPYSAFLNALRNDSWFESANGLLIEEAANLTAQGNRLESWGVTFEVEEVGEFYGDLFLVVMDTKGSNMVGDHFEAQRYFFAAMPGLAGVTAWKGKIGTVQIMRLGSISSTTCCASSAGQMALISSGDRGCGVVPENGGPGFCPTVGNSGANADCQPTFVPDEDFRKDIEEFYNNNMITWAAPSMGPTILFSTPQGAQPVRMRRNGSPLITMVATADRGHHEQLASLWTPGQAGFYEVNMLHMAFHGSIFCGMCDVVALCSSNPEDWGGQDAENDKCGSLEDGDGSDCWDVMTLRSGLPDKSNCPGGCQGPECGEGNGPGGHSGGNCHGMNPASLVIENGKGGLAKGLCGGPTVPEHCKHVIATEGGGCYLTSAEKQKANKRWMDMLGCGGVPGIAKSASTTCVAGGACQGTAETGVQRCMACDDQGACTDRIVDTRDPYSPYVQGGGDGDGGDGASIQRLCSSGSDDSCADYRVVGCRDESGGTGFVGGCSVEKVNKEDNTQTTAKPAPPVTTQTTARTTTKEAEDTPKTTTRKKVEDEDTISPNANPNYSTMDGRTVRIEYDSGRDDTAVKKTEAAQGRDGVQPTKQEAKGDPVLLSSGSLDISHADLSFPGAVDPLTFSRTYNSRSSERSILGKQLVAQLQRSHDPTASREPAGVGAKALRGISSGHDMCDAGRCGRGTDAVHCRFGEFKGPVPAPSWFHRHCQDLQRRVDGQERLRQDQDIQFIRVPAGGSGPVWQRL